MREFNAVDAWAHGLRFFSGRAGAHLAILGGVGILIPFAIQFLLIGQAAGLFNAAAVGSAPSGGFGAAGLAAALLAYLLQIGSYFASWRLGFGRDESIAGALGFGMIAALLSLVAVALVVGLLGFGLAQVTPLLGVAVAGIALMLIVAVLWTSLAALIAMVIVLGFGLSMLVGLATGNAGFAATIVGGSGAVVVLLIVIAGILLWLAARFSCAAVLLAERRSFDLFAAMSESWRLTWEDEWRILRYLALVGLVLVVGLFAITFLAGLGMTRITGQPAALGLGLGAMVVQMIVTLPIAYLAVLVPAGIHRELAGAPAPVEIFA